MTGGLPLPIIHPRVLDLTTGDELHPLVRWETLMADSSATCTTPFRPIRTVPDEILEDKDNTFSP